MNNSVLTVLYTFTGNFLPATSGQDSVYIHPGSRVARALHGNHTPTARALILDYCARAPRHRLHLANRRPSRRPHPLCHGARPEMNPLCIL